jgi:RNA polymerase sigma-70 factor (ECF subfamily)
VHDAARAQLEREVRERCDRADHGGAATILLRGYGPEIFGFLKATHRNRAEADEVFALFAEQVWSGLPRFAWESSVRLWAYAVARHVSKTLLRNEARRRRRLVNQTDSLFEQVVQNVRTNTLEFLRTEKKSRLQALRDSLPEDDRALLVLRVDRRLEWKDLARVLSDTGEGQPLDDDTLAREAARLRKRFQIVRDRLRDLARREGPSE